MLPRINRIAILCLLVALIGNDALAIPQFSALTGNRCSNCHVNTSGGGIRNDLGWYSWYDVGIIPRDAAALKWAYDADSSNQFFDGTLTLGMDLRAQSARGFTEGSERKLFQMQASLYAAFAPVKAVALEASFNLAALRKGPNTDVRVVYPGQRMGSFSAYYMPDQTLPSIRVGLFRPSVGMRYDDHTMAPYSYTNANTRQTYLAPDWSEFGAELTYESIQWLTLQAGVFGSEGLSQILLSDGVRSSSAITGNAPTITSRAVFWPRFANDIINTWIGGSYLLSNGYSMASVFASVGWSDHVALMLDYTMTNKTGVISSRNFMAEISFQIFSPVLVYARYERYFTVQVNVPGTFSANAGVLGAQVFVLPYVELRPEFRLWDTWREGTSNRWAVQLHIFY